MISKRIIQSYESVALEAKTKVRENVVDAHHHLGQEWGTVANFKEVASMYKIKRYIALPYNDEMHEDCKEVKKYYPEVFTPLGFINPDIHTPDRVDQIRKAGFAGLKIYYNTKPYDCEEYMPFWEKGAEWGAPCVFHTSHHTKAVEPISVTGIAKTFPNWKIQAAHFGSECWKDSIKLWKENENVFYDFSGSIISRYSYDVFSKEFGDNMPWERMLFGSDQFYNRVAPYILMYEDMLDYFGVPESIRELIFTKNATDLYNLDGKPGDIVLSKSLTLKKIEMPFEVIAGKPFDVNIELEIKEDMPRFNAIGIHLYRSCYDKLHQDPYGINCESIIRNTTMWKAGETVRIDTLTPTILSDMPKGEYVLKVILQNSEKNAQGNPFTRRHVFTNPEIGEECILGKFRIK